MSAYQLPLWVWPTALMGVCGLAVWRGGDDERLAAAGNLANWALSLVLFRARSQDTQWNVMIVDCALLVLYLWLALRSRRYWPLFSAGFVLLLVITHAARALDAGVSGWAYLTAARVRSYMALFAIGYGAWTAPAHARALANPGEPAQPPRLSP